jgi:DNA-binding LytR/AlgR family response regulator
MEIIDTNNQNRIRFLIGKKTYSLSQIIYLQCEGNYTTIYLLEKDHVVPPCERKTLKDFKNKLEKYGFQRINRNTIINRRYIVEIKIEQKKRFVVLRNTKGKQEIEKNITKSWWKFFK